MVDGWRSEFSAAALQVRRLSQQEESTRGDLSLGAKEDHRSGIGVFVE